MKATVRIFKSDGLGSEGYPIKLILRHSGKVRRKTIGNAYDENWEQSLDLPTLYHPDYDFLYDRILEIRKKAQKHEFKAIEDFDLAFQYLLGSEKKEIEFIKYGFRLADEIEPTHKGNARAYRIALKELQKFQPYITFKELSPAFWERFKRFKRDKANSTKRAYLYAFKAIYQDAVKLGYIEDAEPFKDVFKDIPVRKRRAKNHYFDKEQILQLKEAEFTQHNYSIARDIALLQFYCCGADLTDLIHLRKDHLTKKRIILQREKLGDKKYEFDILLSEQAKEILERYKGEGKYVMYFADMYNYPTFRVKMYRCLQQIKKQLNLTLQPLDANFTWKIMRHSFATIGKFSGVHEDILRELMGHERNDIDTVYKDKYPEADRDEAQLKITTFGDL